MASSSSRGHKKSYKYDVFLSFRGEDTRKTFVDHLYAALDRIGIYTFKDDEKLERGKEISDELLRAIEDSRFYIIVFSRHYTSSSWCLNELLKIMECLKTNEHTAFPVFYDVDPSEVRKQTGSVEEALSIHEDESEVRKWREALKKAAGLSGLDVKQTANGHEAKVIEMIVRWVSLKLRLFDRSIDENLIGMKQRMQDLDEHLKIGLMDVRMVAIKGMGGAGKTTLALALFDKLSINFEGTSFVENVREKASRLGLEKLQEQILRDVLKNKAIEVSGIHEGKTIMKNRLCSKKVLVVLDDVGCRNQLETLAGDLTWFKPGSRVIITTRDEDVLEERNVKWIYNVNLLTEEESIRLLSRHAFGKDIPTQGYEKHSCKVVSYAGGLPLTIKVLGSELCGKDEQEWLNKLERLKTIPLKETLQILKLSYESLDHDEHKEIFLDITCFLRGWPKDDAIRMLESCHNDAKHGLRVLEQKSLISLQDKYYIKVHDHMVELGKNIVRHEHPCEPNEHSRLWVQEEIEQVMDDNSDSVVARCIDLEITSTIYLKSLGNMKKLRSLIINKRFERSLDACVMNVEASLHFPKSLRYLYWCRYPHRCLPKMFEASNLVALEMPCSIIEQLWEGGKVLKNLKFLNMRMTKLRSLDLGLTPKLERLNLEYCSDLVKLDVHGGCLKSLVYLNLHNCINLKSISFIEQLELLEFLDISNSRMEESMQMKLDIIFSLSSLAGVPLYWDKARLIGGCLLRLSHSCTRIMKGALKEFLHLGDIEEIPSSIGNLQNLVSLNVSGCRRLKSVPGSICSLQHLTTLDLKVTDIEELPEDLGQLECLEYLDLTSTKVKHLPNSIYMLKRLKTLNLSNCSSLKSVTGSIFGLQHLTTLNLRLTGIEELPEELGQLECLEYLDLSETKVKHLPNSICMLKRLKTLILCSCSSLEELPEDVGELESLEELCLNDSDNLREIPSSICKLKRLRKLNLRSCKRLDKLPEELGYLECLQLLVIWGTEITHLPHSISLLKGLRIDNSEVPKFDFQGALDSI